MRLEVIRTHRKGLKRVNQNKNPSKGSIRKGLVCVLMRSKYVLGIREYQRKGLYAKGP